ncbi:hypothetical protein PCANB_000139 [Pneumocystis canis]|nr:hypothetical protein PCANB_000139 [Pneumocystis canis]
MLNEIETVINIQSIDEYKRIISLYDKRIIILNFYTNWAQPCQYMNNVFQELSLEFSDIKFLSINAEELDDIAELFKISMVPFFIVLQSGKILTKISGTSSSRLIETVSQFSKKNAFLEQLPTIDPEVKTQDVSVSISEESENEDLTNRLKKLVKKAPVMLFMKGTPTNPQCGFSKQIVNILNDHHVKYDFFDILTDEEIRIGLKEFSDWPTYPQLYIQGNFCGGLDVVREMIKTGEFQKLFQESTL